MSETTVPTQQVVVLRICGCGLALECRRQPCAVLCLSVAQVSRSQQEPKREQEILRNVVFSYTEQKVERRHLQWLLATDTCVPDSVSIPTTSLHNPHRLGAAVLHRGDTAEGYKCSSQHSAIGM